MERMEDKANEKTKERNTERKNEENKEGKEKKSGAGILSGLAAFLAIMPSK